MSVEWNIKFEIIAQCTLLYLLINENKCYLQNICLRYATQLGENIFLIHGSDEVLMNLKTSRNSWLIVNFQDKHLRRI